MDYKEIKSLLKDHGYTDMKDKINLIKTVVKRKCGQDISIRKGNIINNQRGYEIHTTNPQSKECLKTFNIRNEMTITDLYVSLGDEIKRELSSPKSERKLTSKPIQKSKKEPQNSILKQFKDLDQKMYENKHDWLDIHDDFYDLSKTEQNAKNIKYRNAERQYDRLKSQYPEIYTQFTQHQHELTEKRQLESQKYHEQLQHETEQKEINRKNQILREKGLISFGLDMNEYENEQNQRVKEGKNWLALFEWVESKGFTL